MFTQPYTTTISMSCNVGCEIDIDALFYCLDRVTISIDTQWKQKMSGIQWRHVDPYRCLIIHRSGKVIQTGGTEPETTRQFFSDRLDEIHSLINLPAPARPWDMYITTISSTFSVDHFVDLYQFAYNNADECTFEQLYPALHWRFRDKRTVQKRKTLMTDEEKRRNIQPTCCLFAQGCVILTGVKTFEQRAEIYDIVTRAITDTIKECTNRNTPALKQRYSNFLRASWPTTCTDDDTTLPDTSLRPGKP